MYTSSSDPHTPAKNITQVLHCSGFHQKGKLSSRMVHNSEQQAYIHVDKLTFSRAFLHLFSSTWINKMNIKAQIKDPIHQTRAPLDVILAVASKFSSIQASIISVGLIHVEKMFGLIVPSELICHAERISLFNDVRSFFDLTCNVLAVRMLHSSERFDLRLEHINAAG